MRNRTDLPLIASVLFALASLAGALNLLPPALSPLAWLGALWLPGAALSLGRARPETAPAPTAHSTRSPTRHLDPLWLPLASGPALFGMGITLGRLAGVPLTWAATATILLGFLALVLRLSPWNRRKRASRAARTPAPTEAPRTSPPLVQHPTPTTDTPTPWHRFLPAAAVAGVFLLGVLPPLLHPSLRVQADARLHLPIVQRILAGSFPPENPFLAGTPLPYFWFYHVVLAGTARLTHIPLDLVPALLSAQALLVLLLAVDRLGRRFALTPLARAAGVALVGLGFTPWGWVRLVVEHLAHPEINWALAKAYGVSALLPLLAPQDPRLAASLTKIAVTNALPMSLALLVLAATPPLRSTPGTWIRRAAYAAGSLFFHVAAGGLLVAGLAVSWLLARLAPASDGTDPIARSIGAAAALVAAAVVTAPYLAFVIATRTGNAAATLTWNGTHALGLELTLAGLVLAALPVAGRWLREGLPRAWLAVAAPAALLPWFVHLVDGNEYKCIFVLLVLLAPPAGAGLARLARGRALPAGLVLLLFLPTPLLVANAYLSENPPGLLHPAERKEVERVGAMLPPDAVLWRADPGHDYTVLTLPLGHPSYVSDPYPLRILGQWNSEEARWRRGSLLLARQGQVHAALQAAAERLRGRPLYAILTHDDAVRFPRLARALPRLGRAVASLPRFTMFRITPEPKRPAGAQQRRGKTSLRRTPRLVPGPSAGSSDPLPQGP